MSTGIVEELGRFFSTSPSRSATRLELAAGKVTEVVAIGDSIAVNGCRPTLFEVDAGWVRNEIISHTSAATRRRWNERGAFVNLAPDVVARDLEPILPDSAHSARDAPRAGRR